jgi:hypothetical protein
MSTGSGASPATLGSLRRRGSLQGQTAAAVGDPDREVHGVVLAERLERLRALAPHSLVVLTGDAAAGGWALAVALRTAWERNAVGVVAAASACSESAGLLAERLHLALFAINGDVVDLALNLAAEVSAPEALRDRRIARCAVLLSEQNSIRGVLGVLNGEFEGVPVALTVGGDLLAGKPAALGKTDGGETVSLPVAGPGSRAWGQLVAFVPEPTRSQLDEVAAALGLARAPVVAALARVRLDVARRIAREQSAFRRLRAALQVGDESALTAAQGGPTTGSGPVEADTQVPSWLGELGWQLRGELVAVYLIDDLARDKPPAVDATTIMSDWWSQKFPALPLVAGEDGWISWCSDSVQIRGVDVVRQLRRKFADVAAAHGLCVGVGGVHRGPPGLLRSVDEARLAARAGTAGSISHYDELGVRVVLACMPNREIAAIGELAVPELFAAKDRDVLVETVLAVLNCGGSLGQAASILGVHRNTVLGRLRRARELGADIDDPEKRLALHALCSAVASLTAAARSEPAAGGSITPPATDSSET